ncbi:MAG TPA: OmpW family outer membrane protein [Kofleriaceae bacterium]
MRSTLLGCLAVIAWPVLGRAEPAAAPNHPPDKPEAPAPAAQPWWHGFYFRLGGALVKPVSSSREMVLSDVSGPASLAVQNGPIAGSGAKADSATIPAGIVGYVLPWWNRRLSVETILGPPFTVKFQATGTLANTSIAPTALGIPTGVGPLGPDLGEAKAVPPVLTVVYQLTGGGAVRPYVGGGASVLFASDAHVTNAMLTAVHPPEMTIAPAPGLVVQGGLDVRLWNTVYARLDVKFIALMTAHAEVHHIEVKTPGLPLFDSVEVGTAKMDVRVNPFIVQAAVGVDL